MQTRNRNKFTTIHTEGALLPADLLDRIADPKTSLQGLTPESYHLAPGEKLNEAISRSWNRMTGLWEAFKNGRAKLNPGEPGTTLTRDRWLLPLFQELGYGRLSAAKAVEVEGKSYPISHSWENVPIHLAGCGVDLDRRPAAGGRGIIPHSLMQEYLNREPRAQWGLISNGLNLRILRDNATLTRQAYIDFDLEAMFEGEVFSDFTLLWLLAHQSRFEAADERTADCWLERWSKSAQEQGTRALEDLRRGVEEAIGSLGQGFLRHPLNGDLKARLKKGDLSTQDFYRQILRLVYRLIFLFVAEDRDLLAPPGASETARERYYKYYSTSRLRDLSVRQRGSRHHDLYEGLRQVMTLLGSADGCPELAIPALGGFLFDPRTTADLNAAALDNQALLSAVRALAFITDGRTRRAVDFCNLGSEELGSVYESLLELHPLVNMEAGTFELSSAAGNERKTTGSYYTPTSLIQVLLDSALDPVVEDRLKGKKDAAEQEQALLGLKVCDPACGSGHFLIAAAHRIAGRLARVRAGGDEPTPLITRGALRDVIRHCLYGVDLNPMAVELCKVNLWLESLEPGKPLSFLDAHIRWGNSLVGVGPGMDISEIPDEAFNPVFDDDKTTSSALKQRNKRERSGQLSFQWNATRLTSSEDLAHWRAERAAVLEAMPEDDPNQVFSKAREFEKYQQMQEYITNLLEYDLWTAAFFWPMPKSDVESLRAPTQQEIILLRSGTIPDAILVERVHELAEDNCFFHWELAFPQIFSGENPGFDCVLSNPPWDMVELSEKEFFSSSAPEIADAATSKLREKLIVELESQNPQLYKMFINSKRSVYSIRKFVQKSSRFPYSSEGRINLYPLFVELESKIINSQCGGAGIIVPSAIAMDAYNANLFGWLLKNNLLKSLFDFDNKLGIFPAVDSRYRFCLLSLSAAKRLSEEIQFCYQCRDVNDVKDKRKKYSLSLLDVERFSPNTYAPPILLTVVDKKLAQKIYEDFGVLIDKKANKNPWQVSIQRMLSLSDPGDIFCKYFELTSELRRSSNWSRLYCGKAIHQYNHRFANYDGNDWSDVNISQLGSPGFVIDTEYYVKIDEVEKRLFDKSTVNWLLCYRDITNATNERTVISTVIPYSGCDTTCRNIFFNNENARSIAYFLANINSIIFDYFARQKIIGLHLNASVFEQLPIIPPAKYDEMNSGFVIPHVLELVYTSNDIRPFAEDTGYYGEPFKWNEDRRAVLRAELDAYYARLYGLNRKQLRYILDPADLTPRELEDILDPWEEVTDPLDPAGYDARRTASNFPGETFRVLKDKEMRNYGEYRTRRLVLEAWDRLEGTEVGNEVMPVSGEWPAAPVRPEIVEKPAEPAQARREPPAVGGEAPAAPVKKTPAEKPAAQAPELQPMLSDFGLYKCGGCGKLVVGYDREDHVKKFHEGKKVEWTKR